MSDNIGDVTVKVIADATGFTESVTKSSDEAGAAGGRALASALGKAFQAMVAESISPALDEIRAEVDAMVDELSAKNISIGVKVDDDVARAELDEDSRDRTMTILERVQQIGLGGAATAAKGLAGVALPTLKFGSIATGISSLLAPLMSLSAMIGPIAGDLANMWPLVLAGAPALGAVGAAAGVVITAFKTLSTSTVPAAKQFSATLDGIKKSAAGLEPVIDQNFFAPLSTAVKNAVGTLFPQLQAGLGGVAAALGSMGAGIATTLGKSFSGGQLTGFLKEVAAGFAAAKPGIDDFIAGLTTIVIKLGPILPSIGSAISSIGADFQSWTKNTDIAAIFQTATVEAGNLIKLVSPLGGIITGVFGAITNAGNGGGLVTLGNTLSNVSRIVNDPTFQKALSTLFSAASIGAKTFGDALGPLGKAIAVIAPAVGSAVGTLAQLGSTVLAQLLPPVATLISTALPPLVSLMGALLPAAASIVTALLPLVTTLLPPLAKLFQALIPVIQPLIGLIGPLASIVGAVLTPVIAGLTAIMPVLSKVMLPVAIGIGVLAAAMLAFNIAAAPEEFIVAGIVAALALLVAGIGLLVTHWTQITTFLSGVWSTVWNATIDGLKTAIAWIANTAVGVWDGVKKAWSNFTDWLGSFGNGIVSFFKSLPTLILSGLASAGTWLLGLGKDLLTGLVDGLVISIYLVKDLFLTWPAMFATWLVNAIIWLYQSGVNLFQGLWNGAMFIWNTVILWFKNLPTLILTYIVNVGTWLTSTGEGLLQGFLTGITTAWTDTVAWFKNLPNAIHDLLVTIGTWEITTGEDLLHGFLSGIETGYTAVSSWLTALPGKIKAFVASAASWLVSAGTSALHGMLSGIESGYTAVSSYISGLPGKIKSSIGNAKTWLLDTGAQLVAGLKAGISGAWTAFTGWVNDQINKIPAVVRKALGIKSPSTVMAEIGGYMMSGLQKGINDNASSTVATMQAVATKLAGVGINLPQVALPGFGPGFNGATPGVNGYSAFPGTHTANNYVSAPINISGATNPQNTAEAVVDELAAHVSF